MEKIKNPFFIESLKIFGDTLILFCISNDDAQFVIVFTNTLHFFFTRSINQTIKISEFPSGFQYLDEKLMSIYSDWYEKEKYNYYEFLDNNQTPNLKILAESIHFYTD